MLITRAITGAVFTPDGKPAAGARVLAQLDRHEEDGGIVVPKEVRTVAGEDGRYTLQLWPNERGSSASKYLVTIRTNAPGGVKVSVVVPDGTGPLAVEQLIDRLPYPPIGVAEQAVRDAQAAASSAVAHVNLAVQSATDAGTFATRAQGYAEAAETSAGVSTLAEQAVVQSKEDAAESALAAAQSESQATQANTEAAAHRLATEQAATAAGESATGAETSNREALASAGASASSAEAAEVSRLAAEATTNNNELFTWMGI